MGGGLKKGTMTLAGSLVSEKAAASALVLEPDISVPFCLSPAPFKLLSFLWSLGRVFVGSASVLGPLKRMLRSAAALPLT